jgi:hypothetical protein
MLYRTIIPCYTSLSPRQSLFNPPWAVVWRLWYSISPVLLAFVPPPGLKFSLLACVSCVIGSCVNLTWEYREQTCCRKAQLVICPVYNYTGTHKNFCRTNVSTWQALPLLIASIKQRTEWCQGHFTFGGIMTCVPLRFVTWTRKILR